MAAVTDAQATGSDPQPSGSAIDAVLAGVVVVVVVALALWYR